MLGRAQSEVTLREMGLQPSLRNVLSKGRWVAAQGALELARMAAWLPSQRDQGGKVESEGNITFLRLTIPGRVAAPVMRTWDLIRWQRVEESFHCGDSRSPDALALQPWVETPSWPRGMSDSG